MNWMRFYGSGWYLHVYVDGIGNCKLCFMDFGRDWLGTKTIWERSLLGKYLPIHLSVVYYGSIVSVVALSF